MLLVASNAMDFSAKLPRLPADKLTDFSSHRQVAAQLCSHCNNINHARIAAIWVTAETPTRALQKSWIAKLTYLCRDIVNQIGDSLCT